MTLNKINNDANASLMGIEPPNNALGIVACGIESQFASEASSNPP